MDEAVSGTQTFQGAAEAYDFFMGRYSRALASPFADSCLPDDGRFLDVGCGPGALTEIAAQRLGAPRVAAVDPAQQFVEACRARCPGVDVRLAPAEQLPFADGEFAATAAQLVMHFVSDPARAVGRMRDATARGGRVSAAVWDRDGGMQLLSMVWDAARTFSTTDALRASPLGANGLRFGRPGELAGLWREGGLVDVDEATITVEARYTGIDELWQTLLAGIGPAGTYVLSLARDDRDRLRSALSERVGHPGDAFSLAGLARVVRGRVD
ncbi:class I SAM-dependent methyltransferase [Microbacterium sp.]|uniref:class I SAM-dependent methyltransferase n=1 Tax=Microbacterium sp. TaxID=51671 RepID=UPI003A90421A